MAFPDERMSEIENDRRQLEAMYGLEIRVKLGYWRAFTGGGGQIALLAFVFGAIAGGFFSGIGEDLWQKLKGFTKKITDRHRVSKDDSKATILAVFEYKGFQITALLEIDRKRAEALTGVYGVDPVEIFWGDLAAQANQIMKMIDEQSDYVKGASAVSLQLDDKEKKWILQKYVEKLDVDKFAKPASKAILQRKKTKRKR